MFCNHCGKENKDDYNFCIACGKKLNKNYVDSGINKKTRFNLDSNSVKAAGPKHAFNISSDSDDNDKINNEKNNVEESKQNNSVAKNIKHQIQLKNSKGNIYKIDSFPAVIGVGKDVDCILAEKDNVSEEHIKLHLYKDDKFVLEDLHSSNKTYINGYVLEPDELVVIEKNDVIKLGNEEFVVTY